MNDEPNTKNRNWPKDEFGRHEVIAHLWTPITLITILIISVLAALLLPGIAWLKTKTSGAVVVYCAQDQTYAEPILKQFEEINGIRAKAVYDSEAVKTVGLANRLLAERDHPRADIFWGNEEMRTRQLARFNIWRETNGWASFGARVRCLVINTNLVAADKTSAPDSLLDLTNRQWRGKVAIAFPQFGTTATHFHALRQHWGNDQWQDWCRALVANEVKVVDGNSVVVKLVGRGEAWVGLTDSDDVAAGQRDGLPVASGPDLSGTRLYIPNTVGIVRGARHPENAQRLSDHLQSPEVVRQLVEAGAIQFAQIPARGHPTLNPDWDELLGSMESTAETLNEIFLK